jgi:hypothetical protein
VTKLRADVVLVRAGQPAQRRQGDRGPAQDRLIRRAAPSARGQQLAVLGHGVAGTRRGRPGPARAAACGGSRPRPRRARGVAACGRRPAAATAATGRATSCRPAGSAPHARAAAAGRPARARPPARRPRPAGAAGASAHCAVQRVAWRPVACASSSSADSAARARRLLRGIGRQRQVDGDARRAPRPAHPRPAPPAPAAAPAAHHRRARRATRARRCSARAHAQPGRSAKRSCGRMSCSARAHCPIDAHSQPR